MALLGCGQTKGRTKQTPKDAANDKPPLEAPHVVQFGPGSADRLGGPDNREKLWNVKWQSAQLEIGDKNQVIGDMQQVSGDIFQKGKVVCHYSADASHADKRQQVLVLSGRVKLTAEEKGGVLTCNQFEYDANSKIAKVKGSVAVTQQTGVISGDEFWTTPDLKKVATPDMFGK